MPAIAEWLAFCQEFRRSFHTTGAVLPSSRFLARAITQSVAQTAQPLRILEAGPGTGAFTNQLLRVLKPNDQLVLVELNDRFVGMLTRRLDTDDRWRTRREQVRLIHGSVEELAESERYHAIICGLPFNNFEPEFVDRLFRIFLSRLEPGGTFSFFEYLWIRGMKLPFVKAAERERLTAVGNIINRYLTEYGRTAKPVVLNVPPAVVHHLQAPLLRSSDRERSAATSLS